MQRLFLLVLLFCLGWFSSIAQTCADHDLLYKDLHWLKSKYTHNEGLPTTRLDTVLTKVKVVKVKDGDTAEILYGDFYINVRFDHIDAPEIRGGQAYAKASRKFLIKLIEGKTVYLLSQRTMKGGFGRILGVFYTKDGLNVNKALVAQGFAWHYTKYSKNEDYANLENCARQHKVGLWKEPHPITPWEWRKGKRP